MSTYFNSDDKSVTKNLSNHIYNLIRNYNKEYNDIILLCIGTDRSTGDSLAPMIGYKLKNYKNNQVYIYGDLINTVHAKNLDETINKIYSNHANPLIIAIDACLGKIDHVGFIEANYGEIKAGSGVGKDLTPIGDIHIIGIVNFSSNKGMDYLLLQNTRLSLVMKLSEIISICLEKALNKATRKTKIKLIA